MKLTIKMLLCLTLLAALLVNGLNNHFAARSMEKELSYPLPASNQVILEQRILILRRALEASRLRRSKLEKLGAIIAEEPEAQKVQR